MKLEIKKSLVRMIWLPVVLRIEKARAVIKWREGVKACNMAYKKIGKPRFYLFYNRRNDTWMPLVYETRKDCLSVKRMIQMGKMHLSKSRCPTQQEIQTECFYYTPSAWGAHGCESHMRLMEHKQKSWVEYYLANVSRPMAKIRKYLNK